MIDSAEYSADGKFLVLEKKPWQDEPAKVPVALIDELIERGLSHYDLQRLLFVRKVTAGQTTRKVDIEDLVKEDLTGKTVGIYFRNWDDSEWLSTDAAVTVAQHEDGDYYFVFPENYTTCYEGECSHHDDEEPFSECITDLLQGTFFRGSETVLVKEKEPTNE